MQCLRKKVMPLLLVVSMLSCMVFSSLTVHANGSSDAIAVGTVLTKYIFSDIFGMAFKDFDEVVVDSVEMMEFMDHMGQKYAGKEEDGDITVDKEDIVLAQEVANSLMLSLQGYYWVQPSFTVDDFLFQGSTTQSSIDYHRNLFATQKYFFYGRYGSDYVIYFSAANDAKVDFLYINSLSSTWAEVYGYSLSDQSVIRFNYKTRYDSPARYSSELYLHFPFVSGCSEPVKIFKSKNELLKYLNGVNTIYTSSRFNNIPSGPLSVNWAQASSIDYVTLNKMMYDAIKKGVTDAGGVGGISDEELQKIVDEKVNEILGSLGDIEENTGQSNVILNEIKGILNQIYAKLDSVIDAIKHSGGGGLGSAVGSAIGTAIGSLFSKIIDAISNGDDTVENAVASLTTRFSGLAEVSKTKFPFSLPWDVIAIVSALSAEPETPKFEFPFVIESLGINYKIDLDFTEFEGLSKASRSFFVLIFAMVLIRLTLVMINRGDLSE